MKRVMIAAVTCSLALSLNGCGSSEPSVSVVDLDKVLDIFEKVLKEKAPAAAKRPVVGNNQNGADAKPGAANDLKPLERNKENAQLTAAFLKRLTTELNKAKLIEDPIGVMMLPSGAIEGFIDQNKDGRKVGASEKKLFRVEIDYERSRLVATDDTGQGDQTYRRDRRYHYRPGGFFMGYMLGSMWGRQNSYYSGARASSRPRYGSMKMNQRGYHSKAVASARTRAKASGRSYNGRSTRSASRGARSGGSRSFRGGK